MTLTEARRLIRSYESKPNATEEEKFLAIEALHYLIDQTKDTNCMTYLGGIYYEDQRFELALKYYDLAAQGGNVRACECLGYIWYYGRTGTKDYEKAFFYFSRAMAQGHFISTYKVADMYKNGYYVKKDYRKYCEIIEALYPEVKEAQAELPEVSMRLGEIRAEQGRTEEAIRLYEEARLELEARLSNNTFFGDITNMQYCIQDLTRLRPIDEKDLGLFDLFELLKTPCVVTFVYRGKRCTVEALMEDGDCVIRFGEKWFRTPRDFFDRAEIGGFPIAALGNSTYSFHLTREAAEWN